MLEPSSRAPAPPPDAAQRPLGRWIALDRLRALAVVAMIQGHVFTALLRPDALSQGVMRWHDRLHGLTAPAFMFGAGLAFGTATYGSYARHRGLTRPLAKRLSWYLLLFVLGYSLQAPEGSLWAALHAQGEQLASATRVGALQLVALALCASQLLILVLPRPRMHVLLSCVLGLAAMLLASPVTRIVGAPQAASFVTAFLEDRGGAHFQPLPWAGFVWLGVGCAGYLAHGPSRSARGWLLSLVGASCSLLAYEQFHATARALEPGWLWRTSPSYFLFRLGCVVLLLGLLHWLPERAPGQNRGFSAPFARHSLVAFVVHLWLLHGTRWTPNLAHRWRRMLSLEQALLVTAALLAITLAAVFVWARLRASTSSRAEPRAGARRPLATSSGAEEGMQRAEQLGA